MQRFKQLQALRDKCFRSPTFFFKEILQEKYLYPKQIEMAMAVRDCDRVAVCGCNSSGKDFAAGRLILWWLGCHYPSKVVVFGPSHRQIVDIVFQEARAAFPKFARWFGMQMPPMAPRINHDHAHFGIGFATDSPFYITGFHSPNLLAIITEAHGMEQIMIDKIFTLKPKTWLMTGNPFSASGEFFDAFHGKAEGWHKIRISAEETPNVIEGREVIPGLIDRKYIEDAKFHFGEDSAMYKASVLGLFPGNIPGVIVPLDLAMQAARKPYNGMGEKVAGLDIAGDSGLADKSILFERYGMSSRIVWKIHGERTTEVVRRVKDYLRGTPDLDYLVVDGVGIGTGAVDTLMESQWKDKIVDFRGGEQSSDPTRYRNKITEAYWNMRLAFQAGFQIPDDKYLIAQISSRKYATPNERMIILEPKADYLKNHASPDEGDACAMTFATIFVQVFQDFDLNHISERAV